MRFKLVSLAVAPLLCLTAVPPAMAGGGTTALAVIGLLADVHSLTTGLTLNQTAADSYCGVTVLGLLTKDDPPASTGLFSASSQCDLTVGPASAKGNAEATIGAWEPFSSAGTVLTAKPTKATAALINNNPASAEAQAAASIKGRVTSTRDIQPAPVPGAAAPLAAGDSTTLIFTVEFKDVEARIGGASLSFEYGIDFQDGSAFEDITFARGRIGGADTEVFFPLLDATDPTLAALLRSQFLDAFAPTGQDIQVGHYLLGHDLLTAGPEGSFGFSFDVTLGEEYTVKADLSSIDSASVVPEPASWALLLAGALAALAWRRRADRG